MAAPCGYAARIGDDVSGDWRMCSAEAVTSPSTGPLAGPGPGAAGFGGEGGCAMKPRGGAKNSTVNGTSPEMPDASNCDIGTVASCSFGAPQSPGHRSIVSFTVNVMSGVTPRLPSALPTTTALPAAVRSSSNGDGIAPTGQLASFLPMPPAMLPGISPMTLKFI